MIGVCLQVKLRPLLAMAGVLARCGGIVLSGHPGGAVVTEIGKGLQTLAVSMHLAAELRLLSQASECVGWYIRELHTARCLKEEGDCALASWIMATWSLYSQESKCRIRLCCLTLCMLKET